MLHGPTVIHETGAGTDTIGASLGWIWLPFTPKIHQLSLGPDFDTFTYNVLLYKTYITQIIINGKLLLEKTEQVQPGPCGKEGDMVSKDESLARGINQQETGGHCRWESNEVTPAEPAWK